MIGGYALEFYWRAGHGLRNDRSYWQEIAWLHGAARRRRRSSAEMLRDAGVTVSSTAALREKDGVRKNGARIRGDHDGERRAPSRAASSPTATYEGDLMAQAGVTFTWGREGRRSTANRWRACATRRRYHQFKVDIPARGADGQAAAGDFAGPAGACRDGRPQGTGLQLSHDALATIPANQVAYPKPAAYDAARYELLARLLKRITERKAARRASARSLLIDRDPESQGRRQQQRRLLHRLYRQDWEYPNASYARARGDLAGARGLHRRPPLLPGQRSAVPAPLAEREPMWGLAKDEFADNDNWPEPALHPRGAPHGGRVRHDPERFQTELTKPDPIGMGSYNSDSTTCSAS